MRFVCSFLAVAACGGTIDPNDGASSGQASGAPGDANGGSTPGGSGTPGGAPSTGPHACAPLDAATSPVTLNDVIAVGRDADGTIYAMDHGGNEGFRAFRSNGSVLQREPVDGSSQEGDLIMLSVGGDAPFQLEAIGTGSSQRMGVRDGAPPAKDFDIDTEGRVLTVVGLDALTGLDVRNIPAKIDIEFLATTPDGASLLVTRPDVDWSYEDFRVYYGPPGQMLERPLVNASRGSATWMTFTVDGADVDAYFGSSLASDPSSYLTIGGTKTELSMSASTDPSQLAGMSFTCLK